MFHLGRVPGNGKRKFDSANSFTEPLPKRREYTSCRWQFPLLSPIPELPEPPVDAEVSFSLFAPDYDPTAITVDSLGPIPSIQEPESPKLRKRKGKNRYRPKDPDLLNPGWMTKEDSAMLERHAGSRRSKWITKREDIMFWNLLRDILDGKLTTLKEFPGGDYETLSPEDKKTRKFLQELTDEVINRALIEVKRVEARSRLREAESDNNSVASSSEPEILDISKLKDHSAEEIDRLLEDFLDRILAIVTSDMTEEGFPGPSRAVASRRS